MNECVVSLTPTKKGDTTIIALEKVQKIQLDESRVAHVAGGQHSGIVVNKQQTHQTSEESIPHLILEFKCFLVDQMSGVHVAENRILKFWFAMDTDYLDRVTSAYDFFRELVRPEQFPRDYVGFIKKMMKQLQHPKYDVMKRIDVVLRQLNQQETESATQEDVQQRKYMNKIYVSLNEGGGLNREDKRPRELIVQEQLLHYLESAYPNILPTEDLLEMLKTDYAMLESQLIILSERNLIKELEPGRWVRKVLDKRSELKIVKNFPSQMDGNKPTVAIITSKYYEKLAVDAMMENKTTFVKYKTEGESNVYTVGYIGPHKVVSTKLPAIGRQMAAQISSGNTVTRLLGTFAEIDHVMLVGVCGGVPHYADFYKHVRLGDILVSSGSLNSTSHSYIYCDKTIREEDAGEESLNSTKFSTKGWQPRDLTLLEISRRLKESSLRSPSGELQPWEQYIVEGQHVMEDQEVAFSRPPPETDRLFMSIGESDVIEVGHPIKPDDNKILPVNPGFPVLHFGPIGSGKPILYDDQMRLEFASKFQCVGLDSEFDQVLESIAGSRKESFLIIRGVADYMDGTKNAEWQPYAALAAASFMKAVLEKLKMPAQ